MPEEEAGTKNVEKRGRVIRGRDFVVTMASLASAGFGVMAALAWNEAIKAAVQRMFPPNPSGANTVGAIVSLFVYAAVVSVFAVLVVNSLAKLAERLGGEKRL